MVVSAHLYFSSGEFPLLFLVSQISLYLSKDGSHCSREKELKGPRGKDSSHVSVATSLKYQTSELYFEKKWIGVDSGLHEVREVPSFHKWHTA